MSDPTTPAPGRRAETVTPAAPDAGGRLSRVARLRRARRRRRLVATAVAVTGVLVAALIVVLPRLSESTGQPSPAGASSPSGSGATSAPLDGPLLLTLVVDDGQAAAMALLTDSAAPGRGSMLLVPTGLIVDVPGLGPQPLGGVPRLPVPDAAAEGLADLLGLAVSGSWELRGAGLAELVDAVGGVQVDVDRDVVTTRPGGARVVVVPAGPAQLLDGRAAFSYATWLAPGEPEQERLARFGAVWRAVLAKFPTAADQVAHLVDRLGTASTTTATDLPQLLAQLARHVRAGRVDYDVLPTTELAAGGPEVMLTLDQEQATHVVARLFPQAVRAPTGSPLVRVLVQNGVGTPGLGGQARDRLVAAGFAYVAGGNAPQLGYPRTLVVVADTTRASRQLGAQVAAALGVPADAVRVAETPQSVAEVLVVLGRDFPGATSPPTR